MEAILTRARAVVNEILSLSVRFLNPELSGHSLTYGDSKSIRVLK
jgi:hypothetical protein